MCRLLARSRTCARSGTRPTYQNISDTVRYVETANTSQMSGLRNCGQTPIVFGYGKSHYANHGRPGWGTRKTESATPGGRGGSRGESRAHAPAKSVTAWATGLMDVRHS